MTVLNVQRTRLCLLGQMLLDLTSDFFVLFSAVFSLTEKIPILLTTRKNIASEYCVEGKTKLENVKFLCYFN